MGKIYKLLAVDIDGTLLTSRKDILQETKEDIKKASGKGKHIVLSTGRCLAELDGIIKELPWVRYGVCVSGALIYDFYENKAVQWKSIDKKLVLEALSAVSPDEAMPHIHAAGESVIQADDLDKMPMFHMGIYQGMFRMIARKTGRFLGGLDGIPHIEKLNFYCRDEKTRQEIYGRLKDMPFSFAFAEETSLELSPTGVSKGSGLISLCGMLEIDMAEAVAVGDSDNDRMMFECAGLPVAMGNASDEIKELCLEVVGDNDHNGVGEAIRRFLIRR